MTYYLEGYEIDLEDSVVYNPSNDLKFRLYMKFRLFDHPKDSSPKHYPIWLMRYKDNLFYGVLTNRCAYLDKDEHNKYYDTYSCFRIVNESEVKLIKEVGELSWISDRDRPVDDEEGEECIDEDDKRI